jgi:hypothetical protein
MPDPIRILEALLISSVTTGTILIVFVRPWRAPPRVRSRISGVFGAGAGIYAGCWWLGVSPNWPPREDQDRLLFILFPALIVVETAVAFAERPRWLMALPRLAIAVIAAPIVLYGSIYISDLRGPGTREWTLVQTVLIFGGLATIVAAIWAAVWLLAERSSSRSVPFVLAIVCAGTSVTVMLSGYASGGLIGLSLSAALFGALIASLVLTGTPEINGLVGVGVVGLFALVMVGRFFGQLTTVNAALLFCAPLLCWLAELPFVRRGGTVLHGMVRVILPAIPVAVALILAQQQFVVDSVRTGPDANESTAEDYLGFGK